MGKRNRFSGEVRERAVRMVLEHEREHASRWEAIRSVASKIGCSPESLRNWIQRFEVDVAGVVIRDDSPLVRFALGDLVVWSRERNRPIHAGASRRFLILTRLYTAAVKMNIQPTRSVPLWRVFRIPPTVFIQPKHSSTRLRLRWLMA